MPLPEPGYPIPIITLSVLQVLCRSSPTFFKIAMTRRQNQLTSQALVALLQLHLVLAVDVLHCTTVLCAKHPGSCGFSYKATVFKIESRTTRCLLFLSR